MKREDGEEKVDGKMTGRNVYNNNNNNNTSICKAHNVSIRAESEAPIWRCIGQTGSTIYYTRRGMCMKSCARVVQYLQRAVSSHSVPLALPCLR